MGVPYSLRVPLEGQGELFIKATVHDFQVPSWPELARRVARDVLPAFVLQGLSELPERGVMLWNEYLRPITRIQDWAAVLRRVKMDNTKVTVTVTVVSAKNLASADLNGLSDPYAKLILGSRVHQTRVIKRDLNPRWNERFTFTMKLRQLLAMPLIVEVFDDDTFSADDSLGNTELELRALVDDAIASSAAATSTGATSPPRLHERTLKLSTQGSIDLKVSVDHVEHECWIHVTDARCRTHRSRSVDSAPNRLGPFGSPRGLSTCTRHVECTRHVN